MSSSSTYINSAAFRLRSFGGCSNCFHHYFLPHWTIECFKDRSRGQRSLLLLKEFPLGVVGTLEAKAIIDSVLLLDPERALLIVIDPLPTVTCLPLAIAFAVPCSVSLRAHHRCARQVQGLQKKWT